jgi:cytochrome c oxidase cbb3-type subunit III
MTVTRALVISLAAGLLGSCGGRESAPEPSASWLAEPLAAIQVSNLVAGPTNEAPEVENPFAEDPNALTQGRQLYTSFNCLGCHGAAGGGGIGPPLADDDWIYGGSDANIYATIIQGRPNGMPAFGPMMSGAAVWKLAAYVKSLRQETESGVSRRD